VSTGAFEARARQLLGDRLAAERPLGPLTTFGVGGPAEWLADVVSAEELKTLVALAAEAAVPVTALGGGSNVLVSDAGVRGLVVRPRLAAISEPADGLVRVEAGATINGLVRWLIGRGRAGLESFAGTPGTVGGAIHGNAHWQGMNIGDAVAHVLLLSPRGRLCSLPAGEMAFGYDTSRLKHTRELVVTVDFTVTAGRPEDLRARARASLAYRKQTQPLALPSAGCVFQNPDPSRETLPPDIPPSAGALVDRAGLKGHRIGGARISDRHANFIVNEGQASAADIRALVELAREAVQSRFGVTLRDELDMLGTF
jgi:UDP-N-acetylmuramate dehydrogenase